MSKLRSIYYGNTKRAAFGNSKPLFDPENF